MRLKYFYALFFLLLICLLGISVSMFSQGIIIDHNCTDITKIPDSWLSQVKSSLRIHYAHTSHGSQIITGLERLSDQDSKYHFSSAECSVPGTTNALRLMDGQYIIDSSYCETYITPELYWQGSGDDITRYVLNNYNFEISLWAWCTQLDYYNSTEVQEYLDTMSQLESEYPGVTFIYMTGNAQSSEQNRQNRNNQIRNYCRSNNKILFDFGDLDCWYNGQQYTVGGLPMEHPHYNGDEAGHTTYESCENKANAFWWMLARIAGWSGAGTDNPPEISLNPSELYFGAITSGPFTGTQEVKIGNTGGGTLNWNAVSDSSWLSCTPASGTNSGIITVSVNISELTTGSFSGIIHISDPGAANSPQTVTVTLTIKDTLADEAPFGNFDAPEEGSIVMSSIPVTGWALDDVEVQDVKIYNGTSYIGDAVLVEGARPDVADAYPHYPKNNRAGWGYMLLTYFLPDGGNGTYTLYAKAVDSAGHETTLGSKTITCDNANAVKPFGAIDTPTQGGNAAGHSYINWGWVLTPQPNSIPTDGSTINVYIDGVNKGHPIYNLYRSDIAVLFPGYANSNNAVGYFALDTTGYDNGVHTISWIATDSGGNSDGIGSRYFSIQNTGSDKIKIGSTIECKGIPAWQSNAYGPVKVLRGYCDDGGPQIIYPGKTGVIDVVIRQLERVVIDLGDTSMRPLKVLPIGSTLDREKGIFYWLPGPGFIGKYELGFIDSHKNHTRKINIMICR